MQCSSLTTSSDNRPLVQRLCLLLALITIVLYWPARNFEFNNYDDAQYLTGNPHVQKGLNAESVKWAFATGYAANWHPLTWLSHLLDIQIFGFNAGGHHLTNLLFHVANTLLLFILLQRWTGAVWRAAFVAALFAWHPMHVESVAWVAERKDVLSACFWLLTLLAYGNYVGKTKDAATSRRLSYILTLALFALGLLCKPMLVSLPLVLLLVDYWPLHRIQLPLSFKQGWPLIVEKIPFFLLSAASCVITFVVQKKGGAVQSLEILPLSDRLANAVISYFRYIGKLVWPVNLSIIYPLHRDIPVFEVWAAVFFLLIIFWVVVCLAKTHPALMFGWLWYVITLVPVIGIVQVGGATIADRYSYIPYIGLFIILAWEVPRFYINLKTSSPLIFSAALVLIACLLVSRHQLFFWQNSVTLFTRAIQVTKDNSAAECDLGVALGAVGRTNEAILHEKRAIELSDKYAEAENNLGMLLEGQGEWKEAARHLRAALEKDPKSDAAYYNLGLIFYSRRPPRRSQQSVSLSHHRQPFI
jgi:hypothetical protein